MSEREKIVRAPELQEWIGLSRSTVWRLVKVGEFPAPIRLHGNAVAWREQDVNEWIKSRPLATTEQENGSDEQDNQKPAGG
ncbi:AlpA family phage regulatory protein [Paraburkholderia strydomiana]